MKGDKAAAQNREKNEGRQGGNGSQEQPRMEITQGDRETNEGRQGWRGSQTNHAGGRGSQEQHRMEIMQWDRKHVAIVGISNPIFEK